MQIPPGTYHFTDKNNVQHTVVSSGNSLQIDPPTGPTLAYDSEWDRYVDGGNRVYGTKDGWVFWFTDEALTYGKTEGWQA